MATRSHIGKQNTDGSITYIYCHWDGYPEHNGAILQEYYKEESKVNELLSLGDLSILSRDIGEKQSFDDIHSHNDDWCLAYGRDRGEDDTEARTVPTLQEFTKQEYNYLFVNGEWECYDHTTNKQTIPYVW